MTIEAGATSRESMASMKADVRASAERQSQKTSVSKEPSSKNVPRSRSAPIGRLIQKSSSLFNIPEIDSGDAEGTNIAKDRMSPLDGETSCPKESKKRNSK